MKAKPLITWIDQNLYPSHANNWDNQLLREEILTYIRPDDQLLDVGAGAGIVLQMNFRGLVAKIHGIDLDERVLHNPMLDEAVVASADQIPYPDHSFDLVFSTNVLEHLANPAQVFKEVARVLKPGGVFLFKTPNKWHYMPSIARLTPHSFHQYINRIRGREVVDTFPTLYRANTPKDIQRLAAESGLLIEKIQLIEGRPEYLRMHFTVYIIGALYERLVNAIPFLAAFRILILGVLRKPAE